MSFLIVSLVQVIISTIMAVLVFVFMEAYIQRKYDNQLNGTEFYEDTTEYDVPSMEFEDE